MGQENYKKTHLLYKQALQLPTTVLQTLAIGGINHPYQRVGLLEVVLPVRAKGLLASDIPFFTS